MLPKNILGAKLLVELCMYTLVANTNMKLRSPKND